MSVPTRAKRVAAADIESAVNETIARAIVTVVTWYAVAGAAFAGPFVWRGVERIDPAAHGATWGFRAVILPGVVLFWPLLALRWGRGAVRPPLELTAHRRAARRRTA